MNRPGLAALAAAVLLAPSSGRAGCLAPTDTSVAAGVGSGPLWGNDAGSLLYVRQAAGGNPALAVRPAGGVAEDIGVGGDVNDFTVGSIRERWDTFYSGTINAADDLAFVAATKLPDDPTTVPNEGASRRGVYARSGRSLYEIGRLGNPSPVVDPFSGPVAWGTFSDAVAADRDGSDRLSVLFSAQLAGATDHRSGIFRWSEAASATSTPLLLTGDPSPAGGAFVSFGRLRGSGPGDAVFFGVTQLNASAPLVPGLFLRRADGAIARIVKFGTAGDAAPGGGTFAIAADFDVDDAGVVSFAATLQNATSATALFRAKPPLYAPDRVLREGDASPIGGSFGSFARATVRANASGELVVLVPLSDDVGGAGLFTVAADAASAQPLVATGDAVAAAAIGPGRAAYETSNAVRVVVPSDGSVEGPTDFRIVSVDQRNAVPLRADSIRFEGRFLLAPWGTTPPASFRGDATRFTAAAALTGSALTKIAEVKVSVSSGPGNNFTFGIGGTDAAPVGTYKFNSDPQTVRKLTVSADGAKATWSFSGVPGPGTFTVDLAAGTFKLSVAAATIQPSYLAANFRVAMFLRTDADVALGVLDAQSFFHRDFRINGKQPAFPGGLRVTTNGDGTPGGTLFVDSLRVARSPAKGTRPATDTVQAAGVLRMCPGTAAPATPTVTATLHVGGFALDGVTMKRVGRTSAYRYAASGADFRIDLAKATFSLKASTAPLADLADAVPGSPTNGPERTVGGMSLAFELSVARVYEASFPVAVVRLPGGKVFQR